MFAGGEKSGRWKQDMAELGGREVWRSHRWQYSLAWKGVGLRMGFSG